MTVYVDELRSYPGRCLPSIEWCHMATDGDLEELHALAGKIGLARRHFQPHRAVPHYDLMPTKRRVAVRAGAVEVTSMELVRQCSVKRLRKGMVKA